jgi:peptide chain release factor 2
LVNCSEPCLYLLTSCATHSTACTRASLPSWCVFDAPAKQARLNELDAQAAAPDLWSDQAAAQQVMRELSVLREQLEPWQAVERGVRDAIELLELAALEDDQSVLEDAQRELVA